MSTTVRYRDPRLEARERERFRVLEDVHASSGGDLEAAVLCSGTADRLGLSRPDAARLIAELIRAGYLSEAASGPMVSLTPAGAAYVESVAGRRRSVRLSTGALRAA